MVSNFRFSQDVLISSLFGDQLLRCSRKGYQLQYPSWHGMDRWDEGLAPGVLRPNLVGKLGESMAFQSLPQPLQTQDWQDDQQDSRGVSALKTRNKSGYSTRSGPNCFDITKPLMLSATCNVEVVFGLDSRQLPGQSFLRDETGHFLVGLVS